MNSNNSIEDYYTIVTDKEGDYKLNINRFIGEEQIENSISANNLRIEVIGKKIYMDYEIYEMEIKNDNQNTIKMDSEEKTKTMYAVDNKNLKYIAFNNEIISEELIVNRNQTKRVNIKFNKTYSTTNKIKEIIFSDIILNFEDYQNYVDKKTYSNRANILIGI